MAKNDGGVNYIRHLLSISEKFIDDERLSPLHISLYYALFQSWNLSKFRNPISVSRDELMRASKIGSANTYTKCLKELDLWEYIKYYPSHNPHKGSQIYLYNFNKTTDNASDISTDKSTDKTTEKGIDKTTVRAVIPSINSINKLNNTNKLNLDEQKKSTSLNFDLNKKSKRKKIAQKKVEDPAQNPDNCQVLFIIPQLTEVHEYFASQNFPPVEADKFYNYFQSNGWLIGGRSKMKDWKAASRNWILNSKKFNTTKQNSNVTKAKNYSEPL